MATHQIIFRATADVTLPDSTFTTDGDMTVVLQNGERVFAIPTANLIVIQKVPPTRAVAPAPEPMPVPADRA